VRPARPPPGEDDEGQSLLEQLRPGAGGASASSSNSLSDDASRKERKEKKDKKDKKERTSSDSLDGKARTPKSPSRGMLMGSLTEDDFIAGADGVKLPKLVHSQTSSGTLQQQVDPDALIERLQDELAGERLERERMSDKVKDLERKLQRSASQPEVRKPTGGKLAPYRGSPVPPPQPSSPNRTRGLHLPSLRTIPHSPSPQRWMDEQATQAVADSNMDRGRDKEVSRAERSKARVEAIGQLEGRGMNNWKERKAEKVARLNDLTVFRESMWGSFFEWHEDYSLIQ